MDEGKIRDMASHMRSWSKNNSLFSVKLIKFYFHSFWLHSFIWTAHDFCLSPSTLNMSILQIQYSCAWFESRSWIQCTKCAISMDEGKIWHMASHMRSWSKNESLFSLKPMKFTLTHFNCIASYELPMSFAYPHPHWICWFSGYNILVLDLNLGLGFSARNARLVWMRVKYDIWPVIWDHAIKMSHFSHWNLWNFILTHFDCIASYELPMSFAYPYAHWICRFSGYNILALDLDIGLGFSVRNVWLVWMNIK